MPRADSNQRIQRLNLAFGWLRGGLSAPDVIQRLIASTGISPRQAYRYVEEAQRLDGPLEAVEATVVFTVRLPKSLVAWLHQYADSTGQTLSPIGSQAIVALLRRGWRG